MQRTRGANDDLTDRGTLGPQRYDVLEVVRDRYAVDVYVGCDCSQRNGCMFCEVVRSNQSHLLTANGKKENGSPWSYARSAQNIRDLHHGRDAACIILRAVVNGVSISRGSDTEMIEMCSGNDELFA